MGVVSGTAKVHKLPQESLYHFFVLLRLHGTGGINQTAPGLEIARVFLENTELVGPALLQFVEGHFPFSIRISAQSAGAGTRCVYQKPVYAGANQL